MKFSISKGEKHQLNQASKLLLYKDLIKQVSEFPITFKLLMHMFIYDNIKEGNHESSNSVNKHLRENPFPIEKSQGLSGCRGGIFLLQLRDKLDNLGSCLARRT